MNELNLHHQRTSKTLIRRGMFSPISIGSNAILRLLLLFHEKWIHFPATFQFLCDKNYGRDFFSFD